MAVQLPDNRADSPEAQAEQRTVRVATQRAISFARDHGVTPIASMGNGHTDLGNPTEDLTSPDFPPGSEYPRTVDNSNYGIEQTDYSAPGGYFRDYFGTDQYMQVEDTNLSTMPTALGEAALEADPDDPFVLKDCRARPAATTSTCRAPRWRRRTPLGWRR